MEKAGRLINILLQIQAHGSVTARQLASTFEVSERTIYRDIEALTLWGVPIIPESGHGGGYSLPKDYTIDPSMFSSGQISMLGVGSVLVQGLTDFIEDPQDLETAKVKLLSILSEEERLLVGRQLKYIHFDNSRWYRDYVHIDALKLLKEAVVHNKRVMVHYYTREDTRRKNPVVSLVDVYGLVYKSDTWYVVGLSHSEKKILRWNVTRIQQVILTGIEFDRPTNFDLSSWWRNELEQFGKGKQRVLLSISKDAWGRFERFQWKKENQFFDVGSQIVVEMIVDGYEWLIDLVTVNRGDVSILEPQELREKIARVASRMVEGHTGPIPNTPSEQHVVDFEILSMTDPLD